jgi:hypothetical protein
MRPVNPEQEVIDAVIRLFGALMVAALLVLVGAIALVGAIISWL